MPKDSQPDPKKVREEKANGQTPLTRENQNQNKRKLNFFKEENGSPDVPLPLFETANEVQHHHSTSRHVNFL